MCFCLLIYIYHPTNFQSTLSCIWLDWKVPCNLILIELTITKAVEAWIMLNLIKQPFDIGGFSMKKVAVTKISESGLFT